MRHGYINYFSVAGKANHNQSHVRKKGLLLAYSSRGIESTMKREVWLRKADWSHLQPYTGSKEREQEVEWSYTPSRPAVTHFL